MRTHLNLLQRTVVFGAVVIFTLCYSAFNAFVCVRIIHFDHFLLSVCDFQKTKALAFYQSFCPLFIFNFIMNFMHTPKIKCGIKYSEVSLCFT